MKNEIWALSTPAELEEQDPGPSPLLGAKVMMVDDDPLMTSLIKTHLKNAGYTNFVVTNNPCDALPLLRREEPGVLLLDLMMPQVSGFELLEAIRADPLLRYTPVIVLTAAAKASAKLQALQLGATDFLSKPVDASELVLRVRNTLAFHQYHDRLINFDTVTGLPNQRSFQRSIQELIARRDLVGGMVAVYCITVPECRQVAAAIEQSAADRFARSVARRLERFVSGTGYTSSVGMGPERAPRAARLGSDRFAVLIEGLPNVGAVESVADRLAMVVSEPVSIGMSEVVPTPWIGIAAVPTDGQNADELLKSASLAAAHTLSQGTSPYGFASPTMNARLHDRMKLGLQLRGAAQRGELRLHYQPKLDVASQRIVGAEALVRWQHPEHGLMLPGRFIPLAEELGLMRPIGQWVMENACRDAATWARPGAQAPTVAINVSKPQFAAGDLCSSLRQVLLDSGLPAHQVVIELTESMLMDDVETVLTSFMKLKALGVSLSIDDFGTGYSSLSYLRRLPLDELKIDRSFITGLPAQSDAVAIVQTVIELGHRLRMSVTAEGIETEEQLECVKTLGCDKYQGFLFSKPVPAEQFVEMLGRGL